MGQYDFRPLRVHRTASQLFAAERYKSTPPWHEVIGTVPPAQALVRPLPLQHQETKRAGRTRKRSKLFQPQRISYEEDKLRKEFFGDHPWELARPQTVLEVDGKDAQRYDWSQASEPGRPVTGESVIQRQIHILNDKQNHPNISHAGAYDLARKEFYAKRLQEDVERQVAKEEAMATGAYFGKTMLQIGMELEDKVFERWKQWATKKASEQEQQRAAMYTGMENESAGQPEESSETRAALANLEGLIPPIEAQGKEVDGSVPAGQ